MFPIKAIVFDMDGVIRIGHTPVDGAGDVFKYLEAQNVPFMLSTNECRYTPEEIVNDLHEMDIHLPEGTPIYTAALAVRDYLQSKIERFPDEKFVVGVIGESGLYSAISSLEKIQLVDNPPTEHYVAQSRMYLVVGTVDQIKISHLAKARNWIKAGARVITTCSDMSDPSSKGDFTLGMPNHMLHMISYNVATKHYSTGKPHPIHRRKIMELFRDTNPNEILFIGDTLYTDIRLAEESGFQSALVLSGNTRIDALKTYVVEPDYVLNSINDVIALLESTWKPTPSDFVVGDLEF